MLNNKAYAQLMRGVAKADINGILQVPTALWENLIDIIENSVDVVRCSECRHWGGVAFGFVCRKFSGEHTKICMHKDDFCSYGERRSE